MLSKIPGCLLQLYRATAVRGIYQVYRGYLYIQYTIPILGIDPSITMRGSHIIKITEVYTSRVAIGIKYLLAANAKSTYMYNTLIGTVASLAQVVYGAVQEEL